MTRLWSVRRCLECGWLTFTAEPGCCSRCGEYRWRLIATVEVKHLGGGK